MTIIKTNPSTDPATRYLASLGERVEAETGRPGDRHHLGKLVLRSLRDEPTFLHQIDGATDERETADSVLSRSVHCALALRVLGVSVGDVVTILSPSNIHVVVPYYASLYIGAVVSVADYTMKYEELQTQISVLKPRVVFCISDIADEVRRALNDAGLCSQVVVFDADGASLRHFVQEQVGPIAEKDVQQFRATDFNPEETLALLIPTSGTTGLPKVAASTHKDHVKAIPSILCAFTTFPRPTHMVLLLSALQWLTATIQILSGVLFRITRLQSSRAVDPKHAVHLINKYRPSYTLCGPALMKNIMNDGDPCDFTCFKIILITGNLVTKKHVQEVEAVAPNAQVFTIYGMTEANGLVFKNDNPSNGSSVGSPVTTLEHKLVNVDTLEDINVPNVAGELWVKGDMMFKGYYNAPEATKEAIRDDGWFRTGDIFYKNERNQYHFVERLKLLIKYMNCQISPAELEQVISAHPGVASAAVSSISDDIAGDLPVAFVVRCPNSAVTAQEIKDLVKEKLSDYKQLRGGVIFLNELPVMSTGKLHIRRLKELAMTMNRE